MSCPALLLWYFAGSVRLCIWQLLWEASKMALEKRVLPSCKICLPWGSVWYLCCLQCRCLVSGDIYGGFLVSELLLAFLCCFSVRRQVEFHCNMADCVLKPGLVLLISLGLELALCTAIPVTGSFLEIVFHMGIITVCYGAFLGVILR